MSNTPNIGLCRRGPLSFTEQASGACLTDFDANMAAIDSATGGGISSKDDVSELVTAGITHVIDMRAEFNDISIGDPRIAVLWLPQADDGTPRPKAQALAGIAFAMSALAQPGHKVYCHCAAGVNRGPTQTYAILRTGAAGAHRVAGGATNPACPILVEQESGFWSSPMPNRLKPYYGQ